MFVLALQVVLRLPDVRSLKEKRAAITPILEGARRRFQVASSEVASQDAHRRAVLGFAAVSGAEGQVREVIDRVERFVWSFPEVEVVEVERRWADE